jgi:hypothetical protein
MLRDHNAKERPRDPRPDPERSYDLLRGSIDVINAFSRAGEDGSYFDVSTLLGELIGTAGTRLLWLGATADGIPVPAIGPEPAKNRRRWRAQGGPAYATGLQAVDDSWKPRLGALLQFMADWAHVAAEELAKLAPDSPMSAVQNRVADDLGAASANIDRVLDGLASLLESRAIFRVLPGVLLCAGALITSAQAVIEHPSADEPLDANVLGAMRVQAVAERALTSFLRDLAERDPEQALARFAEAIDGIWS